MARTTGRSLALLGLLQARPEWSGAELRERLEVSPRTLRRDVEDLRELGYGIEASPGVGGGYRLGPGASVPPLTLSADEAVAIAVGLRAAQHGGVSGIEEAAARALAKLEGSLSPTTRRHVAEVGRVLVPLSGPADEVTAEVVIAVARAVASSQRLRLAYRRADGERHDRRVEPHRVVHTGSRWYLLAWDCGREDWRTLRLDRVLSVQPLRETFVPRQVPDAEVRSRTSRSISVDPYRYRVRLRVHAPVEDVRAHFGPTVAHLQDADGGATLLESGSGSLEEIALYVGTSGLEFEVLDGPDADALRATLTSLAERLGRAAAR